MIDFSLSLEARMRGKEEKLKELHPDFLGRLEEQIEKSLRPGF